MDSHRQARTAAFERFYTAEYSNIFRASYAFCGDPELARDATQEAFKKAFTRWARLAKHEWAGGWVMRTSLNYCRRQLRRKPSLPRPILSNDPSANTLQRLDLVRALRKLPPRQREATLLYYLNDLPIAAIAELMDISSGAVKAHLAKAREALRRSLTDDGDPELTEESRGVDHA